MKSLLTLLAVFVLSAATGWTQDTASVRETPAASSASARKPGVLAVPEDSSSIKAPVSQAASASSSAVDPVKLWTLIRSGGWAMIPLGLLSVLTVMLVIVYLFTLRRSAVLTPNYMNTADVLLKKRDYLGLLAISNRHNEAVARIVQRTLDFATKNPGATIEILKDIAQSEGQSQAASLQHRTVILADIGMLSPMIGLLGTVMGIIESFGVLGSKAVQTTSRDVLLAGGVSQALVATGAGLVLGIVCMGFYSLFRNRVQSLISDLEIASAHVMALIALTYGKKRETSSRVALEDDGRF